MRQNRNKSDGRVSRVVTAVSPTLISSEAEALKSPFCGNILGSSIDERRNVTTGPGITGRWERSRNRCSRFLLTCLLDFDGSTASHEA